MKVSRSALLPYSAAQMYAIVADVTAYPEFLNWCESVNVIERSDATLMARMHIAYSRLNISFVTHNTNVPDQSIELALAEGPFTNLSGLWQFHDLGDMGSKTSIDMQFRFDRSLSAKVFSSVFERIISTQLDAFQKRAKHLYGD